MPKQAAGSKPTVYEQAGILSRVTYAWVTPIIAKAIKGKKQAEQTDIFSEHEFTATAEQPGLVPRKWRAESLHQTMDEQYRGGKGWCHNSVFWTFVWVWRWHLVKHCFLILVTTALRLTSPIVLREYLLWLSSADTDAPRPDWQGYVLAIALGASAVSLTMVQQQQPWYGSTLGLLARQQTIALVYDKLLRLNGASVSAVSPGFIINLVSNDVRRWEDACFFWLYTWAAPLELILVVVMVAKDLDWISALAGVSASLAIIPLQALLVQPVASIRRATAMATDQRVRLASEAVQGVLACKMLGWEDPLTEQLKTLRRKEASQVMRMARIRACNMALQFVVTTLISFCTFATFMSRNGTLNVASAFYALSLLQIPRRTMNSFVTAVQALSELRVSLQRFNRFLHMPEPALNVLNDSTHSSQDKAAGQQHAVVITSTKMALGGTAKVELVLAPSSASRLPAVADQPADGQLPTAGHLPTVQEHSDVQSAHAGFSMGAAESNTESRADISIVPSLPDGTVALTGADYDWAFPFGHEGAILQYTAAALDTSAHAKGSQKKQPGHHTNPQLSSANSTAASSTLTAFNPLFNRPSAEAAGQRVTLSGVRFVLKPGELLGVCGEVGAGKTSLLSALLGELQPLRLLPAGLPVTSYLLGEQQQALVRHQHDEHDQLLNELTKELRGGPFIKGSLAYCCQVPWVVAGSVRDNIVFGSPWNAERYRQVLHACALEPDVVALPAGDMTELGERGINLSGGQKARLALARAAYRGPDVVLMDDPLSAVDPHVGRTLFSKTIGPGGLLKSATRVLVTHQRQYLPHCDRVLVLRGGKPLAFGTWQQLKDLDLPELGTGSAEENTSLDLPEDLTAPTAHPAVGSATAASTVDPAQITSQGVGHASSSGEPTAAHTPASTEVSEEEETQEGQRGTTSRRQRPAQLQVVVADADSPEDAEEAVGHSTAKTPMPHVLNRDQSLGGGAKSRGFLTHAIGSTASFMRIKSLGRLVGFLETHDHHTIRTPRHVDDDEDDEDSESAQHPAASSKLRRKKSEIADKQGEKSEKGKLVVMEGRQLGMVRWSTYWNYARQMGFANTAIFIVILLCAQASYIGSDWWLSIWTRQSPDEQHNSKWLMVYGILTALVVTLGFTRAFMFFGCALRASTRLHDLMISKLLRTPLSFFHTNPAGRILNRFSKDQGAVDDQLPTVFFDALQCGLLVLGALVLVSAAVPLVLPVFLPLALLFIWIRSCYVSASREIKRWDAVTRSPVYATFSSTLKGLPTIRAYGVQGRFHAELLRQLTDNTVWTFAFNATGRWIGFRLDLVSAATLLSAALIASAVKHNVSAALLGLALSNLLQMTGIAQWFTRQSAEVENNMTSVERMLEYTQLAQEPPRVSEGGGQPPAGWPASGALEWQGVSSRYRTELPPVLKDVTFKLQPGTVCGVVGRTGSGKSSLALTLYRLIEVTGGRVMLDGLDVATVGLDALRNHLAIIPQDPVLFSGTVRSNLDPWGRHDDAALWEVLRTVQLQRAVTAMGGLTGRMAEAGDNLSAGQRQLFCLARALLQRAKVLVLDEATANVDRDTDALIQAALEQYVRPHNATARVTAAAEAVASPEAVTPAATAASPAAAAAVEAVAANRPAEAAATAGVDVETIDCTEDGCKSSSPRKNGSVLLVIAHRIDTIMNSDHLLVLGAGRLLEQGSPHELCQQQQQGGVFAGMVAAARLAATAAATAGATQQP